MCMRKNDNVHIWEDDSEYQQKCKATSLTPFKKGLLAVHIFNKASYHLRHSLLLLKVLRCNNDLIYLVCEIRRDTWSNIKVTQ